MFRTRLLLLTATLVAALVAAACATSPQQETQNASEGSVAVAGTTGAASLLAVGDIASCDSDGDEKVAALARERTGRVALLGDVVYDSGTATEFEQCFDPAWGPIRHRLRPALGNHDYRTDGGGPYFDYFGSRAGPRGKGWYAFDVGDHWRAIALNSNCSRVGGCHKDSPQGRWLRKAIANAGDRHIVAYWHAPLFSSGNHGGSADVRPLFRELYRARAAIVLNGHDHHYERFAPQNAAGERRRRGVQQFVVGTGGFKHYELGEKLPNTVIRDNTSFGLLKLRLRADGYSWRFLPSEGSFTDSGSRTLG